MFDVSLLDLFKAELEVHVPALSEGLLCLEKDPHQPKILESLMRAAHSIKGAAKIIGVESAVRIAHVMEDCFVAAQKGQITITPQAMDVLLQGVDALQQIQPSPDDPDGSASVPVARVSQLTDAISAIRNGTLPATPAPAQSAPAPAEVTSAAATPVVATVPNAPPIAPPPTLRPGGNLDALQAETMRLQLADMLTHGTPEVQLDLGAVRDVDPTGLAFLAQLAGNAARKSPRPRLRLTNVSPQIRQLLRLTGLDSGFALV
ncbi:Hpt domain-containing protein [Tuwongella immobilis]|uniref:STAS domain-containing protein n=1 Tax=Tuwongella immobilis TaxID=692036 RepID=A0A6C2YLL5_9BACT|nr:Hpt domain-containing protein [Tuwongella immobilis]VIP02257.1 chemotaxis protein : Chemotaxis protein histidine kinase-like protein OS=Pseudomonas sp. GM74 GN=PMI34_04421 PE=4 SV=1: Hpt: STAS_2 [Tuwongella immobilis]VTS00858.1 chemotaxis protein : Chemotaxis protein histidine kinase-like protein OS=Pseudomonas sp. GM74 GN=PMI34_04421 PE=4 SV=1: Hpt: STAS_2 [Tuwongella immobilis]